MMNQTGAFFIHLLGSVSHKDSARVNGRAHLRAGTLKCWEEFGVDQSGLKIP